MDDKSQERKFTSYRKKVFNESLKERGLNTEAITKANQISKARKEQAEKAKDGKNN